MADDLGQLVLNRTWRPQLAVIGMDGYPAPGDAGNVLLPYSTAKLSLRMPPTLDAEAAVQALKQTLEADPPYGAEVTFEGREGQSGWNAPPLAPWLEKAVAEASQEAFGQPAAYMGEGGTIPFMGMLGEKFPATQFVITGVLGPALQRARAQRVPAHPDRQARDHGHGAPDRGALRAGEVARERGPPARSCSSGTARVSRAS